MKRPLLIAAAGLVAGILAADLFGTGSLFPVLILFLLYMAGSKRIHFLRRNLPMFLLLAGGVLAGLLLYVNSNRCFGIEKYFYGDHVCESWMDRWILSRKEQDPAVIFVGRPGSKSRDKEEISGRLTAVIDSVKRTSKSQTVFLKSGSHFQGEGMRAVLYGKCLISGITEEMPDLYPGDRVTCGGYLCPLEKAENPGQFDGKTYYLSMGIRLRYVAHYIEPARRPLVSPKRWAYLAKEKMASGYERCLSLSEVALLKAMVLGDKSDLNRTRRKLYEENGAAHLLSLSGLHVSIIAGRVFRFLRRRGIPYAGSSLAGALFLLFYGLAVGGGNSLFRATLMFLTFLVSEVVGADYDMVSSMSLALILMLIESPFRALESGCIISFATVLAIGMILPETERLREMRQNERHRKTFLLPQGEGRFSRALESAGRGFYGSLILFLSTAPLIMSIYYSLAPLSILLNLILIPAMVPLMISGLLGGGLFLAADLFAASGMISAFLYGAGRIICLPAVLILRLFSLLFTAAKKVPFARIITGHPPLIMMVSLYGLEIVLFFLWYHRKYRKIGLLIVTMSLVLLFHRDSCLKIRMISVGQGDSILIEYPNGRTMLIDGGSTTKNDIFAYIMEPAFNYYGYNHLDYVAVTHMDEDHISGIREMLKSGYPVRHLILPDLHGEEKKDEAYQEILKLAARRKVPCIKAGEGDRLHFGKVKLLCLNPYPFIKKEDRNDTSLVFYLAYGAFDALFTGDIGENQEKEMMDRLGHNLRPFDWAREGLGNGISFLKCAHHGSDYSSSDYFLRYFRPGITGISAGKKNRYHHPGKKALKRLKKNGCSKVYCTSWKGAVLLQTDGKKTKVGYW